MADDYHSMEKLEQRKRSGFRIAFIGSGDSHYDPGIKPLLALTQGLSGLGQTPCLFLSNGGADAVKTLGERLTPAEYRICDSLQGLREACHAFNPDFVMADDSITGIRQMNTTRRALNALTGVYIHVFFGLHALRPPTSNRSYSRRLKLKLRIARSIPFSLLTTRRRRDLERIDLLVANSQFSEILTRVLYGVSVDEVIYPPIDASVFTNGVSATPRGGVLVFVGSELDSAPEQYALTLNQVSAMGIPLHLVGSPRMTETLSRILPSNSVIRHTGLTDLELAALYRRVQVTFIPQEWEDFGNVGPESLLCGTPVVLLSHQPWMEITGPTDAVAIAKSEAQAVSMLVNPPAADPRELSRAQSALKIALSRETAAKKLVTALSTLSAKGTHATRYESNS
jgi:glycosyltransferase involved in cell wall biosynthesis